MKKLSIDLKHCYGIRDLKETFEFGKISAVAVYAPNGAMKSSLAKTFQDLAERKLSSDRIFPNRNTVRKISDETGKEISPETILVVRPYDEIFGHTERTSTLLVNASLREEYVNLHSEIDVAKEHLLEAIRLQSGSKRNFEEEISRAFTKEPGEFFRALIRIKDEVESQKDHPFANIKYDTIFDEKVLSLLGTKDVKSALASYITKYNELLAASTYFKKGVFNYYNASSIAKSLADNGFFKAKHGIRLNADAILDVTDEKQLEDLIKKEKDQITGDVALRKTFTVLEKALQKNITVRDFEKYISENELILPELENIEKFREEVLKSYLHVHLASYQDVIAKFQAAAKRRAEIEAQAKTERTQWEEVIDVFNSRFFVPFKLEAKNRLSVMLGQDPILTLGFRFDDGVDSAAVERSSLMEILSTGEKKALYILNVIFEIEARRKSGIKTLLIVDDVADSFDYKNKYAIIQYLMELADGTTFSQMLLTHNFDFFRTVHSRYVPYTQCFMASKDADGLKLAKASGIKNVFVRDWKKAFFNDRKKRLASIPFMRNLVEYTKGESDPDYLTLTSLLHLKSGTDMILESDLDKIYANLFGGNDQWSKPKDRVIDSLFSAADDCIALATAGSLEDKIVLSLASRVGAEKHMIAVIDDQSKIDAISSNQTTSLLDLYSKCPNCTPEVRLVVQRVVLMTPENIHLNSFMYEPILDMSDDHLRALYNDVRQLS